MKEKRENFADLLQEMGNKTASEEHLLEMLFKLMTENEIDFVRID